jgi:hypothetical protein
MEDCIIGWANRYRQVDDSIIDYAEKRRQLVETSVFFVGEKFFQKIFKKRGIGYQHLAEQFRYTYGRGSYVGPWNELFRAGKARK